MDAITFIRAALAEANEEKTTKILPEAQAMELKAFFERYKNPGFKEGDLVSPFENSGYRWNKKPHVVLDLLPRAQMERDGLHHYTFFGNYILDSRLFLG